MDRFIKAVAAVAVVVLGFAAGRSLSTAAAKPASRPIATRTAGPATTAEAPLQHAPERTAEAAAFNFAERLNALGGTGNPRKRAQMIDAIADDLELDEVREALAYLDRHSVRDAAPIRLRLLARSTELDPVAAFQYAQGLGSGLDTWGSVDSVITSWMRTDPDAAEAAVAEMPQNLAKKAARVALISTLSETDPRRAYALLRQSRAASTEVQKLFRNWSKLEPREAATYAEKIREYENRKLALRSVAETWAQTNRSAALDWAYSFAPAKAPGTSIEAVDGEPLAIVVQSWMRQDAAAALEWLEQLPEDAMKESCLYLLSTALSSVEPQHAIAVAAMMPPGKALDSALYTLISNRAQEDPTGALELALRLGGATRSEMVDNVITAWAYREPTAAAAWAAAQHDGEQYLPSIASAWAPSDSASALEWARLLPEGAQRDIVLETGAQTLAYAEQCSAAAEWIAHIGSTEKREANYREIASWWLERDHMSAREWLATAPLRPEVKAELLKAAAR